MGMDAEDFIASSCAVHTRFMKCGQSVRDECFFSWGF